MEQLKVPIGADTTKLEKGLKDAEKALKSFASQATQISNKLKKNAIDSSKLGDEINKLNADFKKGTISESDFGKGMVTLTSKEKALSTSSKQLRLDLIKLNKAKKDLGSSSNVAGKNLNNFKGKTVNATAATTAFSRGIQDMPFGIMGVSNNITNLSEQFGYLKKKTGSAGAALKAMGKDMMGAGGLTLAISLITSAWVMYSMYANKAVKTTNELVEAQKDLIGGAKAEMSTMSALLRIAKDENLSKEQRVRAINKLKKLYPDYLGNLTLENSKSKEVEEQTNKLNEALIRQAKIKALQSRISDLYAKKYEAESKSLTEQLGIWDTITVGVQSYFSKSSAALSGVEKATENQKEAIKGFDKELTALLGKLKKGFTEETKVGGFVTPDTREKIKPFDFAPLDTTQFDQQLNEWIEKTRFGFDVLNLEGGVDWAKLLANQKLVDEMAATEMAMQKFNENMSYALESGLENSLGGIGAALGTALQEGSNILEGVGSSLLSSLGGILIDIGKMAIAIGVGLEAIKSALSSLNPFAAIAAGVGLIALGSYFSSQSKSIGKSIGSSSGGSSGASSTGSGYSAPRSSGGTSISGQGGGTVVFEIAGTKLVGVLSRTLNKNKSLGGTLSLS